MEEKRRGSECIRVKNKKAETERELQAGRLNSILYLLEASEKCFGHEQKTLIKVNFQCDLLCLLYIFIT